MTGLVFLLAMAGPLVLGVVLRSVFTWRLLALAALGLPLLGAGAMLGWPLYATAIILDGTLSVLILLDYAVSAKPREFHLRRLTGGILSLGEPGRIQVEVAYRGSHATRLVVRDEPPPEFAAFVRPLTGRISPGGTISLSYTVSPPHRGLFRFGLLHLRYRGRLGLLVRQAHYEAEEEIKVYPDVLAVRRFHLLAKAGRLRELGLKISRLRGTGTNFESVREYVAGDEYRWINWKATARRGKPQSNEYQIEQTQNVFLLLDTGRMMVTRAGALTRLDHAINAALMLAHVAAGNGDRVGAMAFGQKIQGYLAPGKGQSQVRRMVEFLYPLLPELAESDYAGAFEFFTVKTRKRSLVCVFTDLIDEEVSGPLLAHLAALAPRHIPVCITLRDPLLDQAARAPIAEPAAVYTKAVAEQVLSDRYKARRFLERRGIVVIDVPPEQLSVAVVNRYVEMKERGRI